MKNHEKAQSVPMVIEQTGCGERGYDICSRLDGRTADPRPRAEDHKRCQKPSAKGKFVIFFEIDLQYRPRRAIFYASQFDKKMRGSSSTG